MFPSLVMAKPATISMYLMAIFLTKWPCLVKICILDLSFPRSQTTNFPLVFITATFLRISVIEIELINFLIHTLDTTIVLPLCLPHQTDICRFHSSQKLES